MMAPKKLILVPLMSMLPAALFTTGSMVGDGAGLGLPMAGFEASVEPCGECQATFVNHNMPTTEYWAWIIPVPLPPAPGGLHDDTTLVAPALLPTPSSPPISPGVGGSSGWFTGDVALSVASASLGVSTDRRANVTVNLPSYQNGSLFQYRDIVCGKFDGECVVVDGDGCVQDHGLGCYAYLDGWLELQGLTSASTQFAKVSDRLGSVNKRLGDPEFFVYADAAMDCGTAGGVPAVAELFFENYTQIGFVDRTTLYKETIQACYACEEN